MDLDKTRDLLDACCDSRELLNEILESIQDVIIVIDLEGRIVFCSPIVEKVLGFRKEELMGADLSVIFTPEDLKHFYPNLLHMARNRETFEGDLMLLRKDGTRFFASMILKSFHDAGQGRAIVAACIQDNDQRKQLEKIYNESHYEDLVQIANGIAHEIRNPLMGIGGFVNRLFQAKQIIHNYDKYHGYIIENIKKIEDLVEKVESFANIPKPSFSRASAKALVESALEPFSLEIGKRKIELTVDVEELNLIVDKSLFITVFSILIANAIDAVEDGGRITIQSERDPIFAKIFISDSGKGISAEDMPYIFKPFFTTKPDRVGIDLATAKRVMFCHGGSIDVQSEPGHGATFTLSFPLERRKAVRVSRSK